RKAKAISSRKEVLNLAKGSLETKTKEFVQLTEEVTNLLEKETGQIGDMLIQGKLVTIEPEGEAVIIGDVHGDLESLMQILDDSNFIEQVQEPKDIFLIFLGDYGDRGPHSAEVYYVVLKLKSQFPRNVILMRGNHEGPEDLLAQPHDLPSQFQQRFGSEGEAAYSTIRRLFNQLSTAVLVKDRYILIHGGFPTEAGSLNDLAYAHEKHPKEAFLEEMLWNDPEENTMGAISSPRGAGKLFGKDVTEAFLRRFGVNALIRGHEPTLEGFKLNHDGKILTLFSRKGEPYYNENGAYLLVDFSVKTRNAEELLKWVHKF
ncbi:MAG TPA: metallophosphoesterase family protein, partial [Candidatus Bathyarchaeia archaeon]|nr:metallophosphoesterase family protein [Candidatus Bathyarchaeia archaeon]